MKKLLESTNGVAAIKVIGGLEEQIRIEIDEKKLAELGVPISEITRMLEQENLNQASGSLYDLDANYLVRILSQFKSVDEIREHHHPQSATDAALFSAISPTSIAARKIAKSSRA